MGWLGAVEVDQGWEAVAGLDWGVEVRWDLAGAEGVAGWEMVAGSGSKS